MSELKTEEEQIEAFKTWWKKNGTALILAVAVGVGGYFGFQTWKQNEAAHISEASSMYQTLVEAAADLDTEKNQKDVAALAAQLSEEYGDTGYAMFAELFVAELEVNKGNYDKAISALERAITGTEDKSFQAVAVIRVARLLAEKEDYDSALSKLDMVSDNAFSVQKNELKGDIYLRQGKRDEARTAYEQAKQALEVGQNHPLLDIKLGDLAKS
ncbi:tetratricopeptide repeat protein [Marinomonas balearica]|uniref:Ancillary SecYEG translocon subunit n=1 Tax=Marinomonas balearica TaxID=491947 RepID=A0A4R6MCL2_9GAMM|nr:tetratricopeptide repeat protein [Marinomonas balearica]TDO99391.1 putative negative regulator of RcsB-dependent stress response [Marinomonas balearica]